MEIPLLFQVLNEMDGIGTLPLVNGISRERKESVKKPARPRL
jgi:hypothetical protein